MTQVMFYIFATIMILSASMVVFSRNSVHAVLFLIMTLFNAAGLFLIAGAEFLAMLLVIVYVGAVAVLFLFVVMMLDVNFSQIREGMQKYTPVGLALGVVLFVELVMVFGPWGAVPDVAAMAQPHIVPQPGVTNIVSIGQVLYTHYIFLFQCSGLILLVAMIGAIVLTLRERPLSRKQDIAKQHERTPADTLEAVSVPLGSGVLQNGGFLRPRESYYSTEARNSYRPVPTEVAKVECSKQEGEVQQ